MKINLGFIELPRETANTSVWSDKPFAKGQAWIDLLLLANYKDTEMLINGDSITIKKGQILTNCNKLADRWGWSVAKVSRFLELLKTKKMAEHKTTPHGTLITVNEYSGELSSDKLTQ
jgi:DNA replication protein DnaD